MTHTNNPTQPTAAHRIKKALIFSGVACAGLLVGFLLFFAAFKFYFSINPQAYLDFAAFKPADTAVEDAKIAVYTPELVIFGVRLDTALFPTVRVEYRLSAQTMRVLQQKNTGFAYDCTGEFTERCNIVISPAGQKYLYAVDEFDQPAGYAVERAKFVKDGTLVTILRDGSLQALPTPAWDTLVDSFERISSTSDLPVTRYHPGP